MEITITLKAKWRLKNNPNYVWTQDNRLYNVRTGRFIKKTLHGLTPGYWTGKEFMKLSELKKQIERIPILH
jgi:hypothetical protein